MEHLCNERALKARFNLAHGNAMGIEGTRHICALKGQHNIGNLGMMSFQAQRGIPNKFHPLNPPPAGEREAPTSLNFKSLSNFFMKNQTF